MWIGFVSLFPEALEADLSYGVTGRARERGIVEVAMWNPRDYAEDKHRTVDDKPYGGGPGMLMKVEPLQKAIAEARRAAKAATGSDECPVIYMSPSGAPLDQARLRALAELPGMTLVAGRYEGVDERLLDGVIDEELSIGDYVLSGGELPALVVADGIARLLPGAVGDSESVEQDSFMEGLLDHPHYTRPEEIDGQRVPAALLSGDHAQIARWRRMMALGRTYERRPDLFAKLALSEEDRELLASYLSDADSHGH